jgi:hypothetical protein
METPRKRHIAGATALNASLAVSLHRPQGVLWLCARLQMSYLAGFVAADEKTDPK